MASTQNPTHQTLSRRLEALPLASETVCSYFPDRLSRFREFAFPGELPGPAFDVALETGYRRCGDIYYQTHCAGCKLCIPYRIVVADFEPSRSQRRVLKRNSDLSVSFASPIPTPEKAEIYERYKYRQHHLRPAHAEEADRTFDPGYHQDVMLFQMYTNPRTTIELEIRDAGRLVGFGTIDVLTDAGSAVYFVFDPRDADRSLGTYAILQGIAWARRQTKAYYHLGFMIPGHKKMDYKRRFRPAQFLDRDRGEWVDFDDQTLAAYLGEAR